MENHCVPYALTPSIEPAPLDMETHFGPRVDFSNRSLVDCQSLSVPTVLTSYPFSTSSGEIVASGVGEHEIPEFAMTMSRWVIPRPLIEAGREVYSGACVASSLRRWSFEPAAELVVLEDRSAWAFAAEGSRTVPIMVWLGRAR
jgi:hypothetical protein